MTIFQHDLFPSQLDTLLYNFPEITNAVEQWFDTHKVGNHFIFFFSENKKTQTTRYNAIFDAAVSVLPKIAKKDPLHAFVIYQILEKKFQQSQENAHVLDDDERYLKLYKAGLQCLVPIAAQNSNVVYRFLEKLHKDYLEKDCLKRVEFEVNDLFKTAIECVKKLDNAEMQGQILSLLHESQYLKDNPEGILNLWFEHPASFIFNKDETNRVTKLAFEVAAAMPGDRRETILENSSNVLIGYVTDAFAVSAKSPEHGEHVLFMLKESYVKNNPPEIQIYENSWATPEKTFEEITSGLIYALFTGRKQKKFNKNIKDSLIPAYKKRIGFS